MIATDATPTFSSREVCDLADVSYRQIDYWTRLGLVAPSVSEGWGSGNRRRWSLEDVLAVRVVHLLMVHRVPHLTIKDVLASLGSSKPLVWIRGRTATAGDAFDFLAEADHLRAEEMVLVFSPEAMLDEIRAEIHNRG